VSALPGRGYDSVAVADMAVTAALIVIVVYQASHTRIRPRVWLAWITWQTARTIAWRAGQIGLHAMR